MNLLLLILTTTLKLSYSFFERDPNIVIKEPFYKDPNFFPSSIEKDFSFYHSLSEIEGTCDLRNSFENYPKNILLTLKERKCIPSSSSFIFLLEEGHLEEAKSVIKQVLLNEIDPSNELKTWLSQKESKVKYIQSLLEEGGNKRKALQGKYSFINYDNYIKFIVKLDDNYLSDKLNIFCYKDMITIKANFYLSKGEFLFSDRKRLFDEVELCEFNYNQFNKEIEVTMMKVNKMKKWDSLFN